MPVCQEDRGIVGSVIGLNKIEQTSKSPTAFCLHTNGITHWDIFLI